MTNGGQITANAPGEAIITITSIDGFAEIEVSFTVYNIIGLAQSYFQSSEESYYFTAGDFQYTLTPSGLKSRNIYSGEVSYEVYNEAQNVVEILHDASFYPSDLFKSGIYRSNVVDKNLFFSNFPSLNFSWDATHRNILQITGGMLYRLAQLDFPDASLVLTIEIINGFEFAPSLQAKYYYGETLRYQTSLLLERPIPNSEYFCQDYLSNEFPIVGELIYFDFNFLNYMSLIPRLGYSSDFAESLRLYTLGSYWTWIKPLPDGIENERQIHHGYELIILDYENLNFQSMLNGYSSSLQNNIRSYWAFNYVGYLEGGRAFIQQKIENNQTHLWIYQSREDIDDLRTTVPWDFISDYLQIESASNLLNYYDVSTKTITISTKNSFQNTQLALHRSTYLSFLTTNLQWILNDYLVPQLYAMANGDYGVVLSEILTDSQSGLNYFTVQLQINPPVFVTSYTPPQLTLPEPYDGVSLYYFGFFPPNVTYYVSYADGYPTLILQFTTAEASIYYGDIEYLMSFEPWTKIIDPVLGVYYEYQEDPNLRYTIDYGEIFTVRFFQVQPDPDFWPEGELNNFIGREIPIIATNPTKYHFYYNNKGIVHLVMMPGYEAEIANYTQFYLQQLQYYCNINGDTKTPWSHIYVFNGFEIEIILKYGAVDFIFRRGVTNCFNEDPIILRDVFPDVDELNFDLQFNHQYQALHYDQSPELIFYVGENQLIDFRYYDECYQQFYDRGYHYLSDDTKNILYNLSENWTFSFSAIDPCTGIFTIIVNQLVH